MKRTLRSGFVTAFCIASVILTVFLAIAGGCSSSSDSDDGVDAEKLNGPGGAPVASIISPAENITIFSPGWVDFAGSVTGGDDLKAVTWDFGNGLTGEYMLDPSAIEYETPGTYTARLTVVDVDGEGSSAERTITAVDDTVKEISPENGYTSHTGRVVFTWEPLSVAVSYLFEMDSQDGSQGPRKIELTGTSQEISGLAAGTYIWCVYAVDKEGNLSSCSKSRALIVALP